MTQAETSGAEGTERTTYYKIHIDDITRGFRSGLELIADAILPPEAACQHFREARIEMLRGFREIIDHRIEKLSRKPGPEGGTKINVE